MDLSSTLQNNYSWIYCLQGSQWWHSSCAQIPSKDVNSKLGTIIPTRNIDINKAADTEQGTNKAANILSNSTNRTATLSGMSVMSGIVKNPRNFPKKLGKCQEN